MSQELWIRKTRLEIKDQTHWAKLRIKRDSETNNDYIDVLVGRKGRPWHAHFGFNLDQTILFSKFRGTTHAMERKVTSIKKKYLETKKCIVDPDVDPLKNLIMKLDMDGSTNEVKIKEFGLI